MRVIRDIEDYQSIPPRPVVTIGNFDGVHMGHQRLLARLLQAATERQSVAFVITFEPHPAHVLAPQRALPLILPYDEKLRIMERFGVDAAVVLTFDHDLAATDSQTFVRKILHERLRACHVLVGPDTRFGHDRGGDAESMGRLGRELDFTVESISPVSVSGHPVSSSSIRALILEGNVATAAEFLGRYHRLHGEVVRGERRGRVLGFPTANLATTTDLVPNDGVYAGRMWLDQDLTSHDAVISVGRKPTFGRRERTIEAHLLDFSGDLYGKKVGLDLIAWLRDQETFRSQDELVAQIARDSDAARALLGLPAGHRTCKAQ